jgi:transcription initiation factor TFIIB
MKRVETSDALFARISATRNRFAEVIGSDSPYFERFWISMSTIGSTSGDLEKSVRSLADSCPRCGKGPLVMDSAGGELFCGNCGYVLKEKLAEVGPEWQAFSQEEKNSRSHTGSPRSLAMHDMGLSTVIGFADKDASGKSLSAAMKSTIERLRTWDGRSQVHASEDRNMRQAFSELDRLADKLDVNGAVIEKSAYIYRKALELGLVRGRSISALIAAALYAACRDTETPRNLKDISLISGIRKKEIARCYRILFRELDLRMPVVNPVKCIARIASRVGIQERTKRRAMEILRRAEEDRSSAGKDPMGLAAAALYVACVMENENKTQKDVADAAGVTEVTIRNRQKGLKATVGILGN